MQWNWELVLDNCTGCGICADVCPHGAIVMTQEMAYPAPVPQACIGCLECTEQCPFDAVNVASGASLADRSEVVRDDH